MKICGIVSEYNPFHKGHGYHIEETRRRLGEGTGIVCCMSGTFVQRGEPALLPKHIRAESAVSAGADVVIELPVTYSLRSAEGFARAAVYILSSLEVVTHLSFGAETADIAQLREAAQALLEHDTVMNTLQQLETGISYAAARERALYAAIKEKADIIKRPNNILAVEYIKALMHYGSPLEPVAIARVGADHDGEKVSREGYASASFIRSMLRRGESPENLMVNSSYALLQYCIREGLAATSSSQLDLLLKAAVSKMSVEDFQALPDMAEGLAPRLYNAAQAGRGFEEIAMLAKTKRYAHSRIRRALMCALLGIRRENMQRLPYYARILAFNDTGRQILSLCREHTSIPVITKPAHVKKLPERAVEDFAMESRAVDMYNLLTPGGERQFSSDWRKQALYIR